MVDATWRSRTSLPLVLLVCFATAVGLGLYALASLRTVMARERGADLARTAARVADTMDRLLFERAGDIQAFADDVILREGLPDDKRRKLLAYQRLYGYYSWIAVIDENGRIVAATDTPSAQSDDTRLRASAERDRDVSRQDWFQEVRRTGTLHLRDAERSPESGAVPAVGFSAPIRGPHGDVRGVVTSRMPLEVFRSVFEQEGSLRDREGEAFEWLIMDRRGMIVGEAHQQDVSPTNLLELGVRSAISAVEADQGKVGFLEEMHLRRQVPVLTGYARTRGYASFPGFDWTVFVRLDRHRAYAPINRLVWTVGAIGLLVTAPLTAFGAWASWKLASEHREVVQARQVLEESVAELSRSNAELQQFAYVASHDLQEPLRMVASYTQLLAKRYKGKLDADADEFIGYAVEGAMRMQRLIQDLLAYSRIGTKGHDFEPVAVEMIVNRALHNLQTAVEEHHAVATHDPLPTIMADERQLVQLFQNLIGNAIKFHGKEPPRIHVSAQQKAGEWVFSVRDNGIGVDPQYADRIFLLFQRLHNRAEYPGTGIGLAICKKIVERHGGRIWVESRLGQGAAFYFTIPIHGSSQASRTPGAALHADTGLPVGTRTG